MVLSPAPKPRRSNSTHASNWTQRFVKASAPRPRQTALRAVAVGLLLIPVFGLLPSQAQTETSSPQTPAVAPVLPNVSESKSDPVTVSGEKTESPVTELSPLPSTQLSSPQLPLSQLTLTELLAVLPAQKPLASQSPLPSSPQKPDSASLAPPKSQAAPASVLPAQTALRTIHVRAIVGGQSRIATIAVKPKMTVGPVLAAMGISLAALDRVTPDASALAKDGMTITVTRVDAKVQTRRVPIRAEVRFRPSTAIAVGRKQTTQSPRNGYFEVTERVWTRDGQVTKREFVGQKIGLAPRHQVVSLGTKSHIMPQAIRPHKRYQRAQRERNLLASRGGSPLDRMMNAQISAQPGTYRIVKTIRGVKSTGYSAGPAGGAIGNWTATGVRCTYGAVAVDPRVIPLGSKLYIEGYGYGFACDTGGAIKGKRIDLAFNAPGAAFQHGRRTVTVHILAP